MPSKSAFLARSDPLLVAFYARDARESENDVARGDAALARNADDDLELYTRLAARPHYLFRVAALDEAVYERADVLAATTSVPSLVGVERVLFFLRPFDAHDEPSARGYAFPWPRGAELRLFDALSFDAVARVRVELVGQHRRAQRLDATGYARVRIIDDGDRPDYWTRRRWTRSRSAAASAARSRPGAAVRGTGS